MHDFFYSIDTESEGLYKEKGSKFIAHALPVSDEDDARSKLDSIKKKYHDARHHCYAWTIGSPDPVSRANDDGEPSNSAGKPILNQIAALKLTNTMVVVVRYFGGTKLGVGGLINAYRTATKEALKHARISKKYHKKTFKINFEYPELNTVLKVLKDIEAEQFDQKFELKCELKAKVKVSEAEFLINSFKPFPDIRISEGNNTN